jgi:ADP-ribose pyrophosphatase YjhB (NUDIX family)
MMLELIPPIRNTPRAVIIQDDNILLLRKDGDDRGERYSLPGGAQELGESLQDALRRECIEEIDTEIHIERLVCTAEFLKIKDSVPATRRHYVEFLFLCSVPDNYTARMGHHPDKHQVDVVWRTLDSLSTLTLHPSYLLDTLTNIQCDMPTYLGTFHDTIVTS